MGEPFAYAGAPVAIPRDIAAAHRRAWELIAAPGTWWRGAERVAIAAETRRARGCALCGERKRALSPAAGGGEHAAAPPLSAAAVDAVHRIATDPGRLSHSWYRATVSDAFPEVRYVELVGVLTTVVSIDAFHRALGLPPEPLPAARPGEPSRQRPLRARAGRAWVSMLPGRGARGAEADLWHGTPGNVFRALSLVPDEVRNLKDLVAVHYLTAERVIDPSAEGRGLARAQIELVAGRVSALNECFY